MQRMIVLLAVLSLFLPGLVSAKLYKCKNSQGEIVYTDQACEGDGEELKLPPFTTYTPSAIPPSIPDTGKADAVEAYKTLKILAPENDKYIVSAQGTVTVGFEIKGPLQSLQGHKFALALNGKKLKARGTTNQIRLNDLNPGTYKVQIFVVDREDKELISSAVSTFHMRRQSNQTSPSPGQPTGTIRPIPGSIPGGANTIPGGPATIPGGQR